MVAAASRRYAACGINREEKISVRAALEAYTIGAARAGGLEHDCGSLEPGKRADLVVLAANPLQISPEDLLNVPVIKTLVVGEEVWP